MFYTIKKIHQNHSTYARQIALVAVCAVFLLSAAVGPRITRADSLTDQINALQQENNSNRAVLSQLQQTATSYQDAIKQLAAQISQLQSQIDYNQARQTELQVQIDQQKIELAKQKAVLAESIKSMYVDGELTTIEMLATSKDLGEFVDKETYRNAVQQKIQDTMAKIAKLQDELVGKQQEVQALLAEQQSQQASLNQSRAEQANLLAYNQQQQADYNQRTKDNQAKINTLIAEQLRANDDTTAPIYFLRFPGSVRGHDMSANDYPYAGAGFGMSPGGCVDNDGPDRWGYCTRQCVSYAAWAVERSGRTAPRYYGDAKKWVNAARRDGIPVYTSSPQPGDVAITTGGQWGHAMYVERVNGNQILVSQYNQQLTGQYSTQWRNWQ